MTRQIRHETKQANKADQVGLFRFEPKSGNWTWSREIFEMHGYRPGEVEPTTELLRRHLHPADGSHLADVILEADAPFSSQHRIESVDGRTVSVVVVGEPDFDDEGTVIAIHGYVIDLSKAAAAESDRRDELIDEAEGLQLAMLSRAPIEQAKGMIMLAYGCNSSDAFRVLIDASQASNTKLQGLATRLVAEMETGSAQSGAARQHLENVLIRLGRRAS